MENIYVLTKISGGGVTKIITTAATKSDLAAIANQVVTDYVKSGYALANVLDYDITTGGQVYQLYYLKKAKTRKTPPALVVLELYELPISTPATFDIDAIQL